MSQSSLNGVLQHIRTLAGKPSHQAMSDSELLDRFISEKDETAFTMLVKRHGPLVQSICTGKLGKRECVG